MFTYNFGILFALYKRMKKIILTIIVCCFIFIAFAQPDTGKFKDAIAWNAARQLQWSDFKATPLINASEAAMTASSININYYTKGNNIFWSVGVNFFPYASWSKQDKQNDYILKHEQLHFDITELYARKFRQALATQVFTKNDIKKLKVIQKSILQQWENEQNKYDLETDHSINEEKQATWQKDIEQRLQALEQYATKNIK